MRSEYLWIVIVALCWGGYPLLARASGYEGPRGTLILMLAGLAPIATMTVFGAKHGSDWPAGPALVKLGLAGLMMGCGLLAFYNLTTGPMDASVSIPIVDVAMLLVSTVLAILIFAEVVTLQKIIGIALLLAGIALLRPT